MVNDPYAQAQALSRRLQAQGLDSCAHKIEDIVAAGSTGTEVLMGLRWIIGEILRTETLDLATQAEIARLRMTLDALLR
jgi:hypothetical protein